MTDEPHTPPAGLGERGKRLWNSIVEGFGLDEHELALLEDAARTADLIQLLQNRIDTDGPMTDAYGGRVNPAALEIRQQRLTLARLLVALRVPTGDEDAEMGSRRPQRRPIRGIHAVG